MKNRCIFIISLIILLSGQIICADQVFKTKAEASYYAEKYHGRKTANGELFNMNDYTAAHKTLPFNTIVRVTNLENNKSVIVRINDRGPFVKGREIDLSKAAAKKLDMINSGIATVKLEIIPGKASPEKEQEIIKKAGVLPDSKKWDIQMGAFNSKDNAQNLSSKLKKDGFKDISLVKVKGKDIIRVSIKSVKTENVQIILDNLEEKGYTDFFVKESI